MVVLSAVLAHAAFSYAFVSVWCAFAALLSAWLCLIFSKLRPEPRLTPAAPIV